MFNPLSFTLRIQYIFDSGIYYTVINNKKVDAYTLEKLFEKVVIVIEEYEREHRLNDTD